MASRKPKIPTAVDDQLDYVDSYGLGFSYALEDEVANEIRDIKGCKDHFSLGNMRQHRRERFLQSVSYSALVENRILDLEEQLREIRKDLKGALKRGSGKAHKKKSRSTIAAKADPDSQYAHKYSSILLSAAKMNWIEYNTPRIEFRHIVDLLMEQPHTQQRRQVGTVTLRRPNDIKDRDGDGTFKIERLRINSVPLCDVLGEIMGKDVAPTPLSGLIHPFKALLTYHETFCTRHQELQRELSTKPSDATARSDTANVQIPACPFEDDTAPARSENTFQDQPVSIADAVLSPGFGVPDEPQAGQTSARGTKIASSEPNAPDAPLWTRADREIQMKHLGALLAVMDQDMGNLLEKHKSLRFRQGNSVSFDDLWHLFAPGDIVYSPRESRAYQVLGVQNGRELMDTGTFSMNDEDKGGGHERTDLLATIGRAPKTNFCIDYFSVAFDGNSFGPVMSHAQIEPYDGGRKITELQVFPIEYQTTGTSSSVDVASSLNESLPLREALLERGRTFQSLVSTNRRIHCEYRDMTLDVVPEMVDSHVIIDVSYYYEKHPDKRPKLGLQNITKGDPREFTIPGVDPFSSNPELDIVLYDDRKIEIERTETFVDTRLGWLRQRGMTRQPFELEQLILLPEMLWGFVLYSREWHPLDVSKVKRVEKSPASFHQLQISKEYKELVEGLVTMHSTGIKPASGSKGVEELDRRDDLVRGEGKGLIILLHGAPGVGKTSTAECVAEYTGRPLLSITCGDIGDTADEVSRKLEYYLNLAHRWGCVMLLDEADIFLSTRTKTDIKRNAIVSEFLRMLEYYSGILFLTTNKVGLVDEAFKSRIHISLYYPPLDEDQTTAIWAINLRRIKENKPHIEFDETDLVRWASSQWRAQIRARRQPWNGRQIRNACQTATALAEFGAARPNGGDRHGKSMITKDHLKAVANASTQFDSYLEEVHGMDDADRAAKNHERMDDYSEPFEDDYQQHERDGRYRYRPYDSYGTRDRYDRDDYGDRNPRHMSTYASQRPQDNQYLPRSESWSEPDRQNERPYPNRKYDGSGRSRGADQDDMPPPPRSQPRRESPPGRRPSPERWQGRGPDRRQEREYDADARR